MVHGSRVSGGGATPPFVSGRVIKTIQSIKEIVGNHSEADIYVMLKETDMDANETTQRLLNQDPFHEVKRKRDKRKEETGYSLAQEQRKNMERIVYRTQIHTYSGRKAQNGGYARKSFSGKVKSQAHWLHHTVAYSRFMNVQEFRVVRDNRGNQNASRELNPASALSSAPATDQVASDFSDKSSTGHLTKHGGLNSFQNLNGSSDSCYIHSQVASSNGIHRKELLDKMEDRVSNPDSKVLGLNALDSQRFSAKTLVSNNSIIGLYSSSSDPVHVPSDTRSPGKVGAIKREVGVVGVRRQPSGNACKSSSRPSTATKRVDQLSQTAVPDFVMTSMPSSRSFSSNQYSTKSHPVVSHQKAPQSNKEWRPKSSQKSSLMSHGTTDIDANPILVPAENSLNSNIEVDHLQENFSKFNIFENSHVIIPEHLQVPEAELAMLTFGSFGSEFDSTRNCANGLHAPDSADQSNSEPCSSVSAPPASSADDSGGNRLDLHDDQVKASRSDSPASAAAPEHPLSEKNESTCKQDLENYADFVLVQKDIPSHHPSAGPQQEQDPSLLSNFPAFDPQPGYDVPFFRPAMDETLRVQGLPSPQEAVNSHGGNMIPTSTVAMIQQQPVAQLYPQVHLSQFPNFVPYRHQFLSPVFVPPPMAVPGYSRSPAYSHLSNGSNYLLMPGCGSHLAASGLKYGASQYKPIPSSSPTGFCTYTNSPGYAINTQGTVGGAIALDDSTGLKYKDGYIPNAQVDTSEIWIQNPREISGLQPASYYNISGQAPNAVYLPSQTGHASFNVAATQSTQMQFSGLYHPSQPAPLANPHPLIPGMAGNVGVSMASAAPGAQVGAYQQPQINHLNWSSNF